MNTITPEKEERGEVFVLVVQTNNRTRIRGEVKEKSINYIHCKRSRHEEDFFFQLIGYLDW